jgi:GAF domain-containing protein
MTRYQQVAEKLLLSTHANRVTVRLDSPAGDLAVIAEAVSGADKIGDAQQPADLRSAPTVRHLSETRTLLVQSDLEHADPPVPAMLLDLYKAKSQMLAPLTRDSDLAGIISVHDTQGPRDWSESDISALEAAQQDASKLLEAAKGTNASEADLRDAAINAILDTVRRALGVQRCTLRQDVLAEFAFPVTHESRSEGVRSLKGDLTIVQSNQPVIEHMLATREQVVQDDTAEVFAGDAAFQAMLQHYGGMRAQIVTPFFDGDTMRAVLSIHDLSAPRHWTEGEKKLALTATSLLGRLIDES